MSSVRAKILEIVNKKCKDSSSAKINTWGNHFQAFYTSPDTEEHCGLNRNPKDLDEMKSNGNCVPQPLWKDHMSLAFTAYTWHHVLRKKQATETQIRALVFYLTQMCVKYSISKSIMTPGNGFKETQNLIKKIQKSDEYKSYESESAIIMNYDDFEILREMPVYDENGHLRRDWLGDKALCAIYSEADIRGINVHGLFEAHVERINVNAGNSSLPFEVGFRIKCTGLNKEKHKNKRGEFIIGCYCLEHVYCDPNCWSGVLELYDVTKVKDDKNHVQKSGSNKKYLNWNELKYIRRPLPIDNNWESNGSYLSRNGQGIDKIRGVADRIDKRVGLSVSKGTNVDIKGKKRRIKLTGHSWRGSNVNKTENEIGSDPSITMETKLRLTNQTNSSLYDSYGGRGLCQKISAVKMKKQLMHRKKPKPIPPPKPLPPPMPLPQQQQVPIQPLQQQQVPIQPLQQQQVPIQPLPIPKFNINNNINNNNNNNFSPPQYSQNGVSYNKNISSPQYNNGVKYNNNNGGNNQKYSGYNNNNNNGSANHCNQPQSHFIDCNNNRNINPTISPPFNNNAQNIPMRYNRNYFNTNRNQHNLYNQHNSGNNNNRNDSYAPTRSSMNNDIRAIIHEELMSVFKNINQQRYNPY